MNKKLTYTTACLAVLINAAASVQCEEDQTIPRLSSVDDKQPAIELTLADAIMMGLENNRELHIQRLNPEIRKAIEGQESSKFDPILSSRLSFSQDRSPGSREDTKREGITGQLGVTKFMPSGTTIGIGLDSSVSDHSMLNETDAAARLGVDITQSLLQGFGADVNLASIRQARKDTLSSEYELRGYAEALVSTIENTYWELYLAQENRRIVQQSLDVAKAQLAEVLERVRIGKTAATEQVAIEAEMALRQESLIDIHSRIQTIHLQLLRFLNPNQSIDWNTIFQLQERPSETIVQLESVERHVDLAIQMRPELNQARLQMDIDDLEIVKTRNGLLPKLDLFITLGNTGYADSFGASFGRLDGKYYDIQTGFVFQFPLGNRASKARHRVAVLNRDRQEMAIENLNQLIQVDVRSAYIEVNRLVEQRKATRATRLLQEEKLRFEREKFRVGKSTSLLVATAQRDLLSSQLEEIKSLVNYHKASIDLYRLEGSLLQRRGLSTQFEPAI